MSLPSYYLCHLQVFFFNDGEDLTVGSSRGPRTPQFPHALAVPGTYDWGAIQNADFANSVASARISKSPRPKVSPVHGRR